MENPIPPYEAPLGDIQLICSPSKLLVLVMESVEVRQEAPSINGGSLTAMIPGKVAHMPEVALQAPVCLRVMLHEVVVLDSSHTVELDGFSASSHVHVTTLLEQKLSHTRVGCPVGSWKRSTLLSRTQENIIIVTS